MMSKYLILIQIAALCGALITAGCASTKAAVAVDAGGSPGSTAGAEAKEVTFAGVGDLQLHGTLLTPEGAGPFPALLLLPGSGPTDRDGNQPSLQTNVLKDIAVRLAKEGVASLRFDKRAIAIYASKFPKDLPGLDDFFSWQAFVGDAKDAYLFLKGLGGIDPYKVGVLGHSEGGALALAISNQVHPAALVLVSTAGRDLGTVIVEQLGQGYGAQFRSKDATKRLVSESEHVVATIRRTGKVPDDVPAELQTIFPTYLNQYLHDLFLYDPTKDAAKYIGPVLVVQGEKDIQISAQRDAPALIAAIPRGHGELYIVKGGSHCLKHPTGPTDPGLTGVTDAAALDKIAEWSKIHL